MCANGIAHFPVSVCTDGLVYFPGHPGWDNGMEGCIAAALLRFHYKLYLTKLSYSIILTNL